MVGTLTNQILWVYAGLHGGSTWGSMQVYTEDFFKVWWGIRLFNTNDLIGCGGDINQSDSVGLCRSTQGLHRYMQGTFFLRSGGEKIWILLIRLFNPNNLIGCGADINQSDSVGLCRSMWGSTWVYAGLHG